MSADEGRGRPVLADTDHGKENTGQKPPRKYSPGERRFIHRARKQMGAFYADPENRRRFEEWMAQQGKMNQEVTRSLDYCVKKYGPKPSAFGSTLPVKTTL